MALLVVVTIPVTSALGAVVSGSSVTRSGAVSVTSVLATGPMEGSTSGFFSFAAAGDLGAGVETTTSLDSLGTSQSDFFLALGDLSYSEITPETAWCSYVISHVGSTLPFELVSGNHEDGGEEHEGLIDNFASCLPNKIGPVSGTYAKEYYFDYPTTGPLARIIVVSPDITFTNGGYYSYAAGSPHYVWTENAIDGARAAGIPWVIVAMHKVCITEGIKPCQIGPDLTKLLISKRVDLVLQAHDHDYQRSKQLTCATVDLFDANCISDDGSDGLYSKGSGTVFVIAGIFGRSLDAVSSSDPEAGYFAKAFGSGSAGSGHGFIEYSVSPDRIAAKLVVASGGSFEDSFSIVRLGSSSWPASAFEFDWSDSNNDGGVDMWDIAVAVPCYNEKPGSPGWTTCAYWDLDLDGVIDIGEFAAIAFQYGKSMTAPFPGQGQPVGAVDPTWHESCSLLDLIDEKYCRTNV